MLPVCQEGERCCDSDGRQIVGAIRDEEVCRRGAGAVLDCSHPQLSSALLDLMEPGMRAWKGRQITRSTAPIGCPCGCEGIRRCKGGLK